MAVYHIREINRGIFGEISKIKEEVEELEDALEQGVAIMALVELSDLYGAIEGFLEKEFPGISMEDLAEMSLVTQRAFKDGTRQSRIPEQN